MTNRRTTIVRLAVTTALASTALVGCTGKVAPVASASVAKAERALAKGQGDKAVAHAEAAVLAAPRDAATRMLLGNAYLEAGRFAAAAQSFADAMDLGDETAPTIVSLSLARIGTGDGAGAVALLDRYEAAIDPADFGLAIALAGQPQRGVYVLAQTLRGGQSTVKVRQNLAYAYALAGEWNMAQLMAAEDVPADKLGARMAEWAQAAAAGRGVPQVAQLLGVTPVADPGQPTALALSNHAGIETLAAEAAAPAPAPGELAPLAPSAGVAETAELAFAPTAGPDSFANAFTPDAQLPTAPASPVAPRVAAPAPAPKAKPTRAAAASPAAAPAAARAASRPAARSGAVAATMAKGDYNIQLGSYYSMSDAYAGWKRFVALYPELAGAQRTITKARVNGRIYYRVAATGYARSSAAAMCGKVKRGGGGCIAYAANRPLPGALGGGSARIAAR